MLNMQIKWFLPLGFFLFISYIIFLADTADYNFAFKVVGYIPYGDKVCHALLYGILALLLNHALDYRRFSFVLLPSIVLYIGSIVVFVFAALEECSQYYISSRTFDLLDMGADFVGVALFSLWRSE